MNSMVPGRSCLMRQYVLSSFVSLLGLALHSTMKHDCGTVKRKIKKNKKSINSIERERE
jgi:ABC-type transport system involved in Fe-S cluster assembly fused permease/ATPase subunit